MPPRKRPEKPRSSRRMIPERKPIGRRQMQLETAEILEKISELAKETRIHISARDQLVLRAIQERLVENAWKQADYFNAVRILRKHEFRG